MRSHQIDSEIFVRNVGFVSVRGVEHSAWLRDGYDEGNLCENARVGRILQTLCY